MGVIVIGNDKEFHMHLSTQKLVIADFSASWCNPCSKIAPHFEQLSKTYEQAVFLKVDVDTCQETAIAQSVTAMPTFIFYRDGKTIDRISGANPQLLNKKIEEHCRSGVGEEGEGELVKGHIDLFPFIKKSESEALNEADSYSLKNCFEDNDNFLQSDCDEQLIISVTFSQAVKIHSIMIKAPDSSGPKTIHFFINQPYTLDFEKAKTNLPVQSIDTNLADLISGNPIALKFVKFQNVQNLQLFVLNNHDGSNETKINRIRIFGSPVATTKMENFKRVEGKKGEAH